MQNIFLRLTSAHEFQRRIDYKKTLHTDKPGPNIVVVFKYPQKYSHANSASTITVKNIKFNLTFNDLIILLKNIFLCDSISQF